MQLTLKRVARKKPTPKMLTIEKVGVMSVRVHLGRTNKTHTPKYVREYRPHGLMQRKKPEAYSGKYNAEEK